MKLELLSKYTYSNNSKFSQSRCIASQGPKCANLAAEGTETYETVGNRRVRKPFTLYATSVLMFERFSDGSVEIYFRDGKKKQIVQLTPEICGKEFCSIQKLRESWEEVIATDWAGECGNGESSIPYKIAFAAVISILFCYLCASFLFKLCSPKKHSRRYTRVRTSAELEG